jgi:hypothetical protein
MVTTLLQGTVCNIFVKGERFEKCKKSTYIRWIYSYLGNAVNYAVLPKAR